MRVFFDININSSTHIEWFAKTCESYFSVLQFTAPFYPHFLYTLFDGFLQMTLVQQIFIFCIGIIENMTELRDTVSKAAGEQGLIGWLIKRLKVSNR